MTPHAQICDRLFSAASKANHFKQFDHYWFHNCPYERLWDQSPSSRSVTPTADVLEKHHEDTCVIFVGDACMHPWELFPAGLDDSSLPPARDAAWLGLGRGLRKALSQPHLAEPRAATLLESPDHRSDRATLPDVSADAPGLARWRPLTQASVARWLNPESFRTRQSPSPKGSPMKP